MMRAARRSFEGLPATMHIEENFLV